MKNVIYRFALIVSGSFLLSCSTSSTVTENKPKDEAVEKEVVEEKVDETTKVEEKEQISSRYNYDKDWEIIKAQIVAKNKSEISDWIRGKKTTADEVVMYFNDPKILEALKSTTYKDLKTETIEGEVYLKFHYIETGKDADGNEVGTTVIMFMFQGDPNFQIDHFVVAG